FSSRRRHTRCLSDWSSDVCSSDLIHSPRVPTTAEIVQALKRMQEVLDDRQIWVNPDCGLKTRGWEETLAALRNLVHAARQMRPVPSPGLAPGVSGAPRD